MKLQEELARLDAHDNLIDFYKYFTSKEKLTNSMNNLRLNDVEC